MQFIHFFLIEKSQAVILFFKNIKIFNVTKMGKPVDNLKSRGRRLGYFEKHLESQVDKLVR